MHQFLNLNKEAKAEKVTRREEYAGKPLGLNTVKLLKVASSAFGISSNECMRIAEHLYLDGYITYPRTESTSYPAKFNFNEILENHKKNSEWGPYVSKILKQGIEKPNKGIDKGDHPPITPVKSAN